MQKCNTWGIVMSESMCFAHFSFAHSCCFLCAISGVNYHLISAFDSNPRISIPEIDSDCRFQFCPCIYDVALIFFNSAVGQHLF